MKYFAYGSNMSFPRLKARVPSAKQIGTFTLIEHTLRFHKVSKKDSSGKCDALFTGNRDDYIIGVLFEISDDEKGLLDKAEGLGYGYEEKWISVSNSQGNTHEALTYYATNTDPSLIPYSWYLYHVINGAREAGFPSTYLEALSATNSQDDPDKERDAAERAIYR